MTKRTTTIITITLTLFLFMALIPAHNPVSAGPSELFFSEYIEGSSYNKALEIYNGTGAEIDLTAGVYNVQMYFNGNTTAGLTIYLTGAVEDGDVFVLAHSSAEAAILAQADQTNGAGWYNGNDAVVLRKGTTPLDVIGQIGTDPGSQWGSDLTSTADNTLRRKETICMGDTDGSDAFDPAVEWDGYPVDTFDGLGAHTASCEPLTYTPIYDIQYTEDPSGDSPLAGQVVTTEGIVTMVLYNGYFIEDPAGGAWSGLWVYDSSGPSLGDRVRVTGTIDEYNNFTEMKDVTSFAVLSSGNPLPAPAVLPTGDVSQEQWEGVLVTVKNVTVTNEDLGYGEWSVSDGSGDVVIDDKGSYTYVPVLGDAIDSVTGPLEYSYGAFKIQPRDDADIVFPIVYTPIYDIQYTTDPSGDSPLVGQTVTTQGVVTAFFYAGGSRYTFIQDGLGPWSGLILYKPDGYVNVGDLVTVEGTVSEYNGMTQIAYGLVTVQSSNHELPDPESLPSGEISQEQWESVFVQAALANVTNADLGYGEWMVDNCGGGVRVDDLGYYTYEPIEGDLLEFVQGPLYYSYGDFKIVPRGDSDIGLATTFATTYEIQGSGFSSPLAGDKVTTEGIVTSDFQAYGLLGGFNIQDPTGDGDPTTSDGVYVYNYSNDVNVGDFVRVFGLVKEYYNLTEVSNVGRVVVCSSGNTIAATPISLPVASVDDFEPYEGMLVTFQQPLTISEYYNFDRYGEIVLTDGRFTTPTAFVEPGDDANAAAADFLLNRITLDDGRNSENPDPAIHPNGFVFDLMNLFRGGDTVTNVTGVMDYSYGLYRIQPTQGAGYENTNPRTALPDEVGGGLKVASFNVLNYFTTIDTGEWTCGPSGDMECRGADTEEEFTRQRDKIIAALQAIDADVVGLIEIENYPGDVPTADLVNGLNDKLGAGTYAYVETGAIGTDAIRQAFIYKPASVSLVGDYAILDSSVDPLFLDEYNRPVLAQTFFDNTTGGIFTVAVNHLKSKGSDCNDINDPDTGDGAGNCNLTRTAAAQALVDWLATDPTGSGDGDFLIIGDLNSYDKEDPIDVILAGGYTDLIKEYMGEFAYSYVFDGQTGYLDHALANEALFGEVPGATIWHINADEPDLIDYDMTYKKDAQDAIYAPDAYRSSDHDPVIVGLNVCDEIPPTATLSVSHEELWPANHKYVTVHAWVDADDNFDDHRPTVELVSVTSNEPDDGLGDGDEPNDIVILSDYNFKLRAERSGNGDGRIYTITYKITDDCGNTTLVSIEVLVPHNQ